MHRMLNRKFAEGRINARTTQDLYKSSAVVLGIPGGPGIPGQYLDQVTADLAKQFKAAPIVIDLPNHGLSAGSSSTEPIKYPEVRARIISLLTELKEARLSIVLLGHSLGALIALDLICHWPESSLRALLIAMPYEFERSPEFAKFLKDSKPGPYFDETGFNHWWKAVLPAYFSRQPNIAEIELLTTGTSWMRNQTFTVGLPSAKTSLALIESNHSKSIVYVEGEYDIILPKNNFSRIQRALPEMKTSLISACGHFPMLENPIELKTVLSGLL